MLFDLYGDFADEGGRGGAMRLSAIVRLADDLRVSETAARSAVHRMVRDGWLATERRGRESVISLTARGRDLFEERRRRIFASAGRPWKGTWCVVAVSVPEARREVRDLIRKRLSWLGFGLPSNGLYLSPRDYADDVVHMANEVGASDYVQVYRAAALSPAAPRDLVARAWPHLRQVDRRHKTFLARFTPQLRLDRERLKRGRLTGRQAFRTRFDLAYHFRRSLFDNPDLPPELLPPGWHGREARELFFEYYKLVRPPALAYFDSVTGTKPAVRAIASSA